MLASQSDLAEDLACVLTNMSRNSAETRITIAAAGGIPPLIALIGSAARAPLQRSAIAALYNLSQSDERGRDSSICRHPVPLIALLRVPLVYDMAAVALGCLGKQRTGLRFRREVLFRCLSRYWWKVMYL